MATNKAVVNSVFPPSGRIIAVPAGGELIQVRSATGVIPVTRENAFDEDIALNVEGIQAVNFFINLTIGSLTSYTLEPICGIDSGFTNEFRPGSWLYSAANNRFEHDDFVDYTMVGSETTVIQFPTFGAPFFKLKHFGVGTQTSSQVQMWISRGWSMYDMNTRQLPN